jgi:Cu/Ag efflux protein CusF
MSSRKLILIGSFVVVSGCAAYELPPVAVHHPANAQAQISPAPPRSTTLAYTRADMLPLMTAAAAPQEHQDHHKSTQTAPDKTVVGEGKVIATVPSANQLVVEHGEIKGFMEAMTMGYRVEPPSLLDGVKSGDQVRFTIDVPKKAIVKIENLK